MPQSDYWTHLVLALTSFLVTLPVLASPWQGPGDAYKVLFMISPMVMVGLAWWGRRRQAHSENSSKAAGK